MSKLKDPARELQKSRPYSRLPPELFEDTMCWHPLDAGRWKWVDHITLGEARARVSSPVSTARCNRHSARKDGGQHCGQPGVGGRRR